MSKELDKSIQEAEAEAEAEVRKWQSALDEEVKTLEGSMVKTFQRPDATSAWANIHYDLMLFNERRLTLAQQKLSSLLLESQRRSTDRLDASVKVLNDSAILQLGAMKRLKESSNRLESFTLLLIVLAALSIYVVGGKDLPFPFGILAALSVVILYLASYIYPRALKKTEKEP